MQYKELDLEDQPNGTRIEQTLDVVDKILQDPDFADEVAAHNGWDMEALQTQERVALKFLTSRYQWSIALLSTQTKTLREEVGALQIQVDEIYSRLNEDRR